MNKNMLALSKRVLLLRNGRKFYSTLEVPYEIDEISTWIWSELMMYQFF